MSAPLRVVFAEDNFLVREGVGALLDEVEGIEVVAMVGDPQGLLNAVREHQPDAVLTDIRMPPTHTNEGVVAAKRIRAENPRMGVVVLSQYAEEEYAFELLCDGVAGMGYLLNERVTDLDELSRALHEVVRGGSVLDPRVRPVAEHRVRQRAVNRRLPALPGRTADPPALVEACRNQQPRASRRRQRRPRRS
jgi:DNA-binding NarL/FixJ family response regulator